MSSAHSSHCACPDPQVVALPGVQGDKGTDGTNGTNGSDGINAFTIVAGAGFSVPAVNANVTIPVMTSVWAVVGQNIFVQGGGYYEVVSVPSTASIVAKRLGYAGFHAFDGLSPIAGNAVGPAGTQPSLTGLVTPLTDNTGGTPSTSISAQTGRLTIAFYIDATAIADGNILTDYILGYGFTLVKFDARCAKPVTTGGKSSNLHLEITGVPVTGGVVALSGTYIQGAAQAGSALSGPNVGTASSTLSIVASGTGGGGFSEGAFWLIVEVQNMDTAGAFASLATTMNALIANLS